MKKNIFISVIFFILGIAIIGGLLWATTRVVYRDRKIEKEIETLKQEAAKIKNDNQFLSEKISYFETPNFQEKIAKEKLNLQKEDEGVAIIKQSPLAVSKEQQKVDPKENISETPVVPNYKKWWNYFFEYKN
jgi:cell division protein FtsB